ATPGGATEVPGSNGEAYRDPLQISALGTINLALDDVLVLPLSTPTGVVGQYARASDDATSAGAAGAVTDSGGVDLSIVDTPAGPGSERPQLASLHLKTVVEEALGTSLATAVAGLADLRLDVG